VSEPSEFVAASARKMSPWSVVELVLGRSE